MSFIKENNIRHVVVSRIDAIGDAVLTLPTCIYLRLLYPDLAITFLGRSYTEPVIKACPAINHFINFDEFKTLGYMEQVEFLKGKNIDAFVHEFPNRMLARAVKKAAVPVRIGTTSKNYHFFTCNKLIRLSRRNSDLHEAQQNIYLLRGIGVEHVPTIGTISNYYKKWYKPATALPSTISSQLKKDKFNLIIHPKSNGHGREWEMNRFASLIHKLPEDKFRIFITGSEKEHELFKTWMPKLPAHVIDMSGKMPVTELLSFIYQADGLLASGTGPLHLAAASGIYTLGLFPISRSINAARWAPLGKKAEHIESDSDNLDSITVDMVYDEIVAWVDHK